VVKVKTCQRGDQCLHFLIKKLIGELGGISHEENLEKIITDGEEEEIQEYREKIEQLGLVVSRFEREVVNFFAMNGCYPCADPMQICWGRRKYLACLVKLNGRKVKD
jgi:hypothetical protein